MARVLTFPQNTHTFAQLNTLAELLARGNKVRFLKWNIKSWQRRHNLCINCCQRWFRRLCLSGEVFIPEMKRDLVVSKFGSLFRLVAGFGFVKANGAEWHCNSKRHTRAVIAYLVAILHSAMFEAITVLTSKCTAEWNVTPCGPIILGRP